MARVNSGRIHCLHLGSQYSHHVGGLSSSKLVIGVGDSGGWSHPALVIGRGRKIPHLIGGGCGIFYVVLLLKQIQLFGACQGFVAAVNVQLGINALDVRADRIHGNHELFGDLCAR